MKGRQNPKSEFFFLKGRNKSVFIYAAKEGEKRGKWCGKNLELKIKKK